MLRQLREQYTTKAYGLLGATIPQTSLDSQGFLLYEFVEMFALLGLRLVLAMKAVQLGE